jgi:dethiobiotin synthetase
VTGGKALGGAGALVVGSAALRTACLHRARAFVFTTSPAPAVVGALLAAVRIAPSATAERERALGHARRIARELDLPEPAAAIVPFVVGTNARALELADALSRAGIDARAIRPPTVPEGMARLRIACHATNDAAEVERLCAILRGRAAAPAPARVEKRRARLVAVVGTDTGVGKTVVSALLVRALAREGYTAYWKPVQTGAESDTREVERLGAGTGARFVDPLYELPLPASPHEAARAAGVAISLERLDARLAELRAGADGALVLELAGGLLVPLTDARTQADWLADLGAQIVLVARSGLGTLNHTLLTCEALASRGLSPRALVLVGAPHASNRATLASRTGIPHLFELPVLDELDPRALDAWLSANAIARGVLA